MRNIPFGKPMIEQEEKQAVMAVLEGPTLVHGPRMHEFESAFAHYTKAPGAIALSSCTAGLHLSYFCQDIGAGDEVIVPAQTHVATAHAVEFCGAKPVFVDAERQTGNIDIDQIEAAISKRTRAISVVHYLGMPVNMERVMSIAKKYGLFVVEDCALALGSYFKGVHAGLLGDCGAFSFYPVKHMTTAEGGMFISRHKDLIEKISQQRAFGIDRQLSERKIPGVYDVNRLGYNYRLNEMQCALGIEQLKRMPKFHIKRKENYEVLYNGLCGISEISLFESSHGDYQSSYYCMSAVLKDDHLASKRVEVIERFKEKGIGTSIYYPKAVPLLDFYKNKYGYKEGSFPAASWISSRSIAFPVGPHLDHEDMKYIVDEFKNIIKEMG